MASGSRTRPCSGEKSEHVHVPEAGGRASFTGKVTMQLLKMNSVAGKPCQHAAAFQGKVRDSKTDRQLRVWFLLRFGVREQRGAETEENQQLRR